MRRRDFLIATAASGMAYLAAPSVRAFGGEQAAGPDPNFHVYLAFGQSNMEGFPGIEPQDKSGVDPRFRMLAAVDFASLGRQKGEWYDAIPPLCRSSTGLCPADYFGRTMVAGMPERITVGRGQRRRRRLQDRTVRQGYLPGVCRDRRLVDDQHHHAVRRESLSAPGGHGQSWRSRRASSRASCCTRGSPTRMTRIGRTRSGRSTAISSGT